MKLEHVQAPNGTQPAPEVAPDQNSALGRFKRRREALRKASVEDFDVPGYRGDLAVRIQRLEAEQQLSAYEGGELTWGACAQLLLDGCVAMLWRDDDGALHEYRTPIDTAASWVDLAAMSGETVTDARQCVLDIFEGNEQALIGFGQRVDRWMASAEERADDELLGG